MQWTDQVADPRNSVLRATTYCDNNFRESHVPMGTLIGPFARVAINLDQAGTPRSVLNDYTANEVCDSRGTFTNEQITAQASRTSQPWKASRPGGGSGSCAAVSAFPVGIARGRLPEPQVSVLIAAYSNK
jgi:hypothetical protein